MVPNILYLYRICSTLNAPNHSIAAKLFFDQPFGNRPLKVYVNDVPSRLSAHRVNKYFPNCGDFNANVHIEKKRLLGLPNQNKNVKSSQLNSVWSDDQLS